MKHSEVIEKRNALLTVKGLKSHEVNYCIAENLERMEKALKPLNKQEEEIEQIVKEFVEERKKIGEKHATVDGDIKIKSEFAGDRMVDVFDIPEALLSEYKKDIAKLRIKHDKKIKEYEAEREKFIKFLDTGDSPFKAYTVKMVHVPTDISTENMKAIFPFIRKKTDNEN